MKKRSFLITVLSMLLTVTLAGCNTAPAEVAAETAAEPAAETKPESTGKRIYFAGPLVNLPSLR